MGSLDHTGAYPTCGAPRRSLMRGSDRVAFWGAGGWCRRRRRRSCVRAAATGVAAAVGARVRQAAVVRVCAEYQDATLRGGRARRPAGGGTLPGTPAAGGFRLMQSAVRIRRKKEPDESTR